MSFQPKILQILGFDARLYVIYLESVDAKSLRHFWQQGDARKGRELVDCGHTPIRRKPSSGNAVMGMIEWPERIENARARLQDGALQGIVRDALEPCVNVQTLWNTYCVPL